MSGQGGAAPRKPTHNVSAVVLGPRGGDKDKWIRVGAAWTSQDGSLVVMLEAMPFEWFNSGPRKLVLQLRDDQSQGDRRPARPANDRSEGYRGEGRGGR
jgi:hypothetical protein